MCEKLDELAYLLLPSADDNTRLAIKNIILEFNAKSVEDFAKYVVENDLKSKNIRLIDARKILQNASNYTPPTPTFVSNTRDQRLANFFIDWAQIGLADKIASLEPLTETDMKYIIHAIGEQAVKVVDKMYPGYTFIHRIALQAVNHARHHFELKIRGNVSGDGTEWMQTKLTDYLDTKLRSKNAEKQRGRLPVPKEERRKNRSLAAMGYGILQSAGELAAGQTEASQENIRKDLRVKYNEQHEQVVTFAMKQEMEKIYPTIRADLKYAPILSWVREQYPCLFYPDIYLDYFTYITTCDANNEIVEVLFDAVEPVCSYFSSHQSVEKNAEAMATINTAKEELLLSSAGGSIAPLTIAALEMIVEYTEQPKVSKQKQQSNEDVVENQMDETDVDEVPAKRAKNDCNWDPFKHLIYVMPVSTTPDNVLNNKNVPLEPLIIALGDSAYITEKFYVVADKQVIFTVNNLGLALSLLFATFYVFDIEYPPKLAKCYDFLERIRQEKNGGAWCPREVISRAVREFLEVRLPTEHLVTHTETQGRFGNGQGQEFAEAYLLEYWRDILGRWVLYRDARGEKVLTGNTNTYLVVRQQLELPFVASKIRFIPFSEHPRTVCMRVELYGCAWNEGLISYSSPRAGSHDTADSEPDPLEDLSFDGIMDGGRMKGGLGQLTDGRFGPDDLSLDTSKEGHRWVGWLNESLGGQPLEITFEFDGLREFTSVHLHVSNALSRGVKIFSRALVYFSLDGERYQQSAIHAGPPPMPPGPEVSVTTDASRNVTVALLGRVGRYVRLQLHFAAPLILLSEVSFESAAIHGNISDELLEQFYQQENNLQDAAVVPPEPPKGTGPGASVTTHARKEISPASNAPSEQAYIGLVTGALAVLAILLGFAVVLVVRRSRKKELLHTALKGPLPDKRAAINMRELRMSMSLTPISNGLITGGGGLGSASTLGKKNGGVVNGGGGGAGLYGHVVGEESDSETSSVYHEPFKLATGKQEYGCLLKKDALSSSKSGEYTDFTSVNSFQEELKFSSQSFYSLVPPVTRPPTTSATFPTPSKPAPGTPGPNKTPVNGPSAPSGPQENFYAATDIVKTERREQHFTPGRFTPLLVPEQTPAGAQESPVFEFPRHRLRLLEKLGEGNFGMVHLCEADAVPECGGKRLVIVKSLWRGCPENTRQEFLRESRRLAWALRDANLARLVALCTAEEPLCALIEAPDLGDLPTFLQNGAEPNAAAPVSYGCLIYVTTQIASGMKYLESLGIVHRDLAARNCMVGRGYSIKISDHAMFCARYDADYYVSDTKAKLPIRWMAWESLLLGKHSCKSDVWSFAVTLWEVLQLGSQRPFAELTNEQVVENCSHWYQDSGLQRLLSRPAACPREIYDLMNECWRRHESERPRFSEIHLFLQRKNLGFVPPPVLA